jgi:hypothetical protein
MKLLRARSRGQSLVEFSLVIPLFLAMLFAMLDIGRVIWANDSLTNAAREGARYAIVHGGSEVVNCPTGPGVNTALAGCPSVGADGKDPTRQAVQTYAIAGGTSMTVYVCYGSGCSGNTDIGSNTRGTPVTVTAVSTVPTLTGTLLGLGDLSISGSSTMLVNN